MSGLQLGGDSCGSLETKHMHTGRDVQGQPDPYSPGRGRCGDTQNEEFLVIQHKAEGSAEDHGYAKAVSWRGGGSEPKSSDPELSAEGNMAREADCKG